MTTFDYTSKNIQTNKKLPISLLQATTSYFDLVTPSLVRQILFKLNSTTPESREKTWNDFNLPIDEIELKFHLLSNERRNLSTIQGYQSYIEMHLDKYNISPDIFSRFLENKEEVLKYANSMLPVDKNLPSWFFSQTELPCFVCRLVRFPFNNLSEVVSFTSKIYPKLETLQNKIHISFGEKSSMTYLKQSDIFEIVVSENENIRHQSISLIHELGHVCAYLDDFEKGADPQGNGKYYSEKAAIKWQMTFLSVISTDIYKAFFADILIVIRRLLFEIQLYSGTDKKLGTLYAETFNSCFIGAKQIKNDTYILDEVLTMNPFSNLPHALAHSELILEKIGSAQLNLKK